jgi:hypothetical protein
MPIVPAEARGTRVIISPASRALYFFMLRLLLLRAEPFYSNLRKRGDNLRAGPQSSL